MDKSMLIECQKLIQVYFNFLFRLFNFQMGSINQIFQNMNHLSLLNEVKLFPSKKSKLLSNFLSMISHKQETIKYLK